MITSTYSERREQLETYFDRTAFDAWSRLTSDAPLGRVRASVRAGRDRMRETLLSWLPDDLSGKRVLDAGCGTGMLAVEAARRGAHVIAIDVSQELIRLAQERITDYSPGSIDFRVGDMLDPSIGHVDYVVAMDSLIHYDADDIAQTLGSLAQRTETSILFTFAPRTRLLATMHTVGKLFPRGDRAPAIKPVKEKTLSGLIRDLPALASWQSVGTQRVSQSFYISQAFAIEKK